jgi:hydrogenase maturation protease
MSLKHLKFKKNTLMREIEAELSRRIRPDQADPTHSGNPILLLGIGNFLMGDEGIGPQFIHELAKEGITYPQTDVLDGGVGGFTLMGHFDTYDKVIFVDATMDGRPLGTVRLIKPRFASDFPQALSAHDFGLKDMVESMYLLGRVPELYLFTVSIEEIRPMTVALSPAVAASIPVLQAEVGKLIATLLTAEPVTTA